METVPFESFSLPLIHVEVCQTPYSVLSTSVIEEHVKALLHNRQIYSDFILSEFSDPVLQENIISVSVSDIQRDSQTEPSPDHLLVHVFKLNEDGPIAEEVDDESDVTAANHWLLPNVDFQGMWENLIYDCDVKQTLLNYAQTTLLFSDKGVDANIISWNRVILLHGPPGTGKTSLCKALSQKLSIVLSERYTHTHLVEINSHSLFSKWFSESGKLVQKMFMKLQEMVDDTDSLVCVLIDEVESLTAARQSVMSGSEPSDAIRVVNALLTQIDQIKRHPNVIILTTSNVTGAIDLAFVDRADIKQYIGLPTMTAIFKIYHSCLRELARVGIIRPTQQLLDLRALEVMRFAMNDATRLSLRLRDLAKMSEGLSGRTLRKIPFLAHALNSQKRTLTMEEYLDVLEMAVKKQFSEQEHLHKSKQQ